MKEKNIIIRELIIASVLLVLLNYLFFKDLKSQKFGEWLSFIVVFGGFGWFLVTRCLLFKKMKDIK